MAQLNNLRFRRVTVAVVLHLVASSVKLCLAEHGHLRSDGAVSNIRNLEGNADNTSIISSGEVWKQFGNDIAQPPSNSPAFWTHTLNAEGDVVALQEAGIFNVRVHRADDSGVWKQLGNTLFEDDGIFGFTMSLSADGSILAIGSPAYPGESYAYVYKLSDDQQWVPMGTPFVGDTDSTGYAVSLNADGNVVAISAPGTICGKVSVYDWDGSKWKLRGEAIEGQGDFCGQVGASLSLSADGDVIAIGARSNSIVRVYQWGSSAWKQLGGDLQENGYFGYIVSLSSNGNVLAATQPQSDDNRGHVLIFEWNAGLAEWTQRGKDIIGEKALYPLELSMALSGTGELVIVGWPYYGPEQYVWYGQARAFQWDETKGDWEQLGQTFEGTQDMEVLGCTLGADSDGERISIAIPGMDYNNTGETYGRIQVYERGSDNVWSGVG